MPGWQYDTVEQAHQQPLSLSDLYFNYANERLAALMHQMLFSEALDEYRQEQVSNQFLVLAQSFLLALCLLVQFMYLRVETQTYAVICATTLVGM